MSSVCHDTSSSFASFRKFNIVETMVQKLEKYADNLEILVKQRTMELEDEKLKTDRLLYRLLPP
jgi:uncharacterized protein (DUF4213/DUF364 family)